jgi:hypothetical protein
MLSYMNDAIKKFETQLRKTQRMIDALATVELFDGSNAREIAAPIIKAIDRCYTLDNKCYGEPGAEERVSRIYALIDSAAAERSKLEARIVSRRCERMRELEIERARAANARPY